MRRRVKPESKDLEVLNATETLRQRHEARYGPDPRMRRATDRRLAAQLDYIRAKHPDWLGKKLGYDPVTQEVTVDD